MFSYYGSKSKIVDLYPEPRHDTIIEPFAGSAQYSLKYWNNQVILYDKYETIIQIWKYLQSVTAKEILSLPTPIQGETIQRKDYPNDGSFLLMSYVIKSGSATPRYTVCSNRGDPNQINSIKQSIAEQVENICRWEIYCGDYRDIPNQCATWFIDPPYQFGGEHYKENDIDYGELREWCLSRQGQVIVCENTKADWMDFNLMTDMRGTKHTTIEAIWCNHKTSYDHTQETLF